MPEAVKSLTNAVHGAGAATMPPQAFVDKWGVIPAEVEKIVGKFGNIPTASRPP
jgi:hypothetical protein